MAIKVKVDPLKFAYVSVAWADGDKEEDAVYKVFHVDASKIRLRAITFSGGTEVEGANYWVPWNSINYLREVNAP